MPSRWNPRFLRAAIGGWTALSLGACAVTPGGAGVEGTVAVPGKWRNAATAGSRDSAALAKWWERFNDPALTALTALTALIRAALESSPDIHTAVSRIAESRAQRGVERASLFPWLTGSGSAQTSRREDRTGSGSTSTTALADGTTAVATTQSGGGTTRAQTYSGALDASWQVDLFGKQWQNVKAAAADMEKAAEDYHAAQVSLAAEVAEAYIALRSAEEQLAVVRRTVETRSETLQITQWREQAGQGNALDTLQTESTLESARASIPSLQETIGQTRNRLALLAGRTPGGVDSIVAKTRPIPGAPAKILAGIPAETLEQRPDVRGAEKTVLAAVARTKSAQRERLPSLNISGTLSTEALSSGRIFNPQSVAASLLGGLTLPLFKGGEITSTIQVRTEQERQAVHSYRSTVLTALSEVENALISVRRLGERIGILDRAADAAGQARTLASQRFTAGDADILTVLESERTLLSVELDRVSARASRASAHVQLYKALGGGWTAR